MAEEFCRAPINYRIPKLTAQNQHTLTTVRHTDQVPGPQRSAHRTALQLMKDDVEDKTQIARQIHVHFTDDVYFVHFLPGRRDSAPQSQTRES